MKRFFLSRWTLSFLGVALLALLVWFLGPLIDALDSWIVRGAIIAGLLLIWAVVNFILDRRRKRADRALAEGVAATSPAEAQGAEEVAALREKLTRALSLLRKASGTRGYLYEQPWYVIIGPPGAGKTTALLNAGLKFPLAAEMGQAAVAGVGGTRLCDWWFTEQAVMIDTAGRYTTQDSDATVDRAGWEGFLDLLRRTRPRQPLNGVLVAIPAPDLAQSTQAERLDHARAIRRRIKELTDKLGMRLPIYVLFTKGDLLAGFTEFFDDLDAERRGQVWGEFFAGKVDSAAGPVAGWGAALQGLLARLNDRLITRLQAERSPEKRALIAGFPAQFASLETPLGEFLTEAFGGSRLDPAPWLRSVSFTSGTQEGTPIDRLSGVLARAFGLDQRRAPSLRPQKGRSYFLSGTLATIFGEAMLASTGVGAHRRRLLRRGAIFAGVAAVTLLLGGAMLADTLRQRGDIDRLAAALAPYEQTADAQKLDPVSDGDLAAVAPLLDQARALPYGYDAPPAGWHLPFGLSQTGKLSQAAHDVYSRALQRVLLPRLLVRLEGQMRANLLTNADFLYQATRVYLMLGGEGPLDADLVRAWEQQIDWANAYETDPSLQASLARHLDALLAAPLPVLPPPALDGGLINDARSAFSNVTLAQRVYSRIKFSAAAQAVPAWSPAGAIGPTGVADFVRMSGKPLTDGVAGFFTVEGFHHVLLPQVLPTAREVASESWVLGRKSETSAEGPALLTLRDDVIKLYEQDYERLWDAMIADITVAPLGGSDHAAQALYILSSPQSPLRDLLTGLRTELTLSKPPPDMAADVGAKAAAALGGAATQLGGLVSHAPTLPPGHEVDEYYAPIRNFVGTGPGAPIDLMMSTLSDLAKSLPPPGTAAAAAPAGGGGAAAQALKAQATGAPKIIARMATTLAGGTAALRGEASRQALISAYNGSDGPGTLCGPAVTGRYPFSRGAVDSIPLGDFARLFGPGGLFDGFFKQQLAPFVTTGGGTWRTQEVDGVTAPISPADLAQFQRASTIRQLFFAGGPGGPSVSFSLKPDGLDDKAQQATLTLGSSTTITATHSFTLPTQFVWPGPTGMELARLQFTPAGSGTGVLQADGPWALFRLIDQGLLSPKSANQYDVTFATPDHHVSFSIEAGSVQNPFSHSVLQSFSCPRIQ